MEYQEVLDLEDMLPYGQFVQMYMQKYFGVILNHTFVLNIRYEKAYRALKSQHRNSLIEQLCKFF